MWLGVRGCLCIRHCHPWVLGAGAQGAARQALPVCSRSIWHSGRRITMSRSVTELWLCLCGSCRMRSPFTHSQDFHGKSFLSKCFLKQYKMPPRENVALGLPAFSFCAHWNRRCELNSFFSPGEVTNYLLVYKSYYC